MFKISVVYKLGAAIMILMLSVLLPLGFIINRAFTNFYYNNIENDVQTLSNKYAHSTQRLDNPQLLSMYNGLADLTNKEVIVINKQGQILSNSGINGFTTNKNDLQTLSQGYSLSKSFTDIKDDNQYLVSATPVFNDSTFDGAIYVFASITQVNESLRTIRSSLILSGVGAIFLALGFTYFLSRRLSHPLLKMEEATKKIAKGDLSTRISVPSKDELGSLATAINDLAIELERYRSNRSEFFANISHELRTPITYLSGYAHVLQNKLYQSEEEKELYLKIIRDESDRLNKLINDLFDLAKMEEGKFNLNFELIDLEMVLKNSVDKIQLEANIKELDVQFKLSGKSHFILGDINRLGQIFDNLIRNAVRYTDKGYVELSLNTKEEKEVVYIKDSGPGIPANEIEGIFERFYRVEKSRSRNTGGTGLGLAIVKQLVLLHNGNIVVESEVGKGTLFILTFPSVKGEDAHEMV